MSQTSFVAQSILATGPIIVGRDVGSFGQCSELSAGQVRTLLGVLTSAEIAAAYAPLSHSHSFASLTSKPTTLAGFGITDAQPLDSDLTAIAALSTTSFGRSLLALANAAAGLTALGAQATLVSGTNLKTVAGATLLGSGDVAAIPSGVVNTVSGSNRIDIYKATDGTTTLGQESIRLLSTNIVGNSPSLCIGVGAGGQGSQGLGWIQSRHTGGSFGEVAINPLGGTTSIGNRTVSGSGGLNVANQVNVVDPNNTTLGLKTSRFGFSIGSYGQQAWVGPILDQTFWYSGMGVSIGVKSGADVAGQLAEERFRFCSDGEFRTMTAAGATEFRIKPGGLPVLGAFTIASLPPAASNATAFAVVTNSTPANLLAQANAGAWRYVHDNSAV